LYNEKNSYLTRYQAHVMYIIGQQRILPTFSSQQTYRLQAVCAWVQRLLGYALHSDNEAVSFIEKIEGEEIHAEMGDKSGELGLHRGSYSWGDELPSRC
jgi:hypothetical protein